MSFIFLGQPYTHERQVVMNMRYALALKAAAWLYERQLVVFSPIIHSHVLVNQYQWRTDAKFWRTFNDAMLSAASTFYVLCLDGWRESEGLGGEIKQAQDWNKHLRYMIPDGVAYRVQLARPRY